MKSKSGLLFVSKSFFSDMFKASETIIVTRKQKLEKPDYSKPIKFGEIHTDYILEIDYTNENGWEKPKISPYHNFSIDPRNSTLHYAVSLFEGLKAYKNKDDIFLFRPELNMERMNNSAERIALPRFDGKEFLECIKKFVKLEESWIYDKKGYSLYLRPTYMSTTETLGVSVPKSAKLFCIATPSGPYFTSGYKALSLICNDNDYIRSFPGGFGEKKLAANYGPTLKKYKEALKAGYDHVLWLINDR